LYTAYSYETETETETSSKWCCPVELKISTGKVIYNIVQDKYLSMVGINSTCNEIALMDQIISVPQEIIDCLIIIFMISL